jgi:hypothetical protein
MCKYGFCSDPLPIIQYRYENKSEQNLNVSFIAELTNKIKIFKQILKIKSTHYAIQGT